MWSPEGHQGELTPLHSASPVQAGVFRMAGVDISLLGGHFQHHQGLEDSVSIMDHVGGLSPSYSLLSIQEPADLNVAWVAICPVADEQVVVAPGTGRLSHQASLGAGK